MASAPDVDDHVLCAIACCQPVPMHRVIAHIASRGIHPPTFEEAFAAVDRLKAREVVCELVDEHDKLKRRVYRTLGQGGVVGG